MINEFWYKNAIIYSLDLETFMDGNGDGVGDFAGLTRRLEYLHSLGVDVIWLAPFQPSPNKDNGYDIMDYYGVDDRHGSLGDFAEFMNLANNLGIKVIIDLVVNHTSDQHPWFQDARKGEDARHHDWYVWSKKKPEDWDEGVIFPGVQDATWTKDKQAKAYYFHRFYDFQPDLNMGNPEVREEINRVMGFYLSLGVAGFRVDAVPFVLETQEPGSNGNREIRFEYLEDMRRFLQWRNGSAVLLGEANIAPEEAKKYFGDKGGGLHLMFNFFVNQHLFYALATGESKPLADALRETAGIYPTAQWANFLRNHDELDLGRLTDEQREKVFAAFGPDDSMQLYDRGIRRRLAPMLGNRARIELAYSLMFALPGTPVMRYGDEIGMGDDLSLKEREAVRTPMQWSDEQNGGFSSAEAKDLVHPVINQGPYDYEMLNVERQLRERDSLLNWTKRMVRLRKECPEIGYGEWEILDTDGPTVLTMVYRYRSTLLLTVHNFGASPVVINLDGFDDLPTPLVDLIEPLEINPKEKGGYEVRIGSYGFRWFRLRGVKPVMSTPATAGK
ncbi:maltose alpha-D-glucosyltransferase/alpha-amylase [Neolewinella xylanilytica]|uniref:Maltose alpha-D-glucosyltransferase/alpha-amylase n=1 Tax=Neolewinella xylanilytica TaxID=1514080 RepID=A0A2S6I0K7_9BACT|nr:alpha-amylase family protein [Neolewinella xylanilytica]PPK84394.1 maltose alpha-D-glucosyltransferase/alpha-amylase [Neolewinella xylanilytica]